MSEQVAPRIACHLCQSPATVTDGPVIVAKRLDCPQCGMYSISYDFLAYVGVGNAWDHIKPLLSLALGWASGHGAPVMLHNGGDVMAVVAAYEIALYQAEAGRSSP